VFNVTLALAAMDAAIFEGKTSNPALFHYIGQTIRVVYHSLSKSDSAATKSTILAIAVLACLEVSRIFTRNSSCTNTDSSYC
jgi:hypothetical protein